MVAEDASELDMKKPTAGTLAGYHGVRERFWRHSKRYQVEIRDHVCKTKVHITIDRDEKTDEEQAREAALLRDAVARINYEETGKKKALNFPDEEPSEEIMHRARTELDKARTKAAEARAKPKAQLAVKEDGGQAAATDCNTNTAAAPATLREPSQGAHTECEQLMSGSPQRSEDTSSVSLNSWGCRRQRTDVRKRAAAPWHEALASFNDEHHHTNLEAVASKATEPADPEAKLQAFLTGSEVQLPNTSAAPRSQPPLTSPYAWQLQFAQMQAQMHAAAQAAQLQGMFAGLISGPTAQTQAIPSQTPWVGGTAAPWGAPPVMPWAAQAQVAAAAQAAAAANPSATAALAQQAASWAAAQVAASLPGTATGLPVPSLVPANPTSLLRPLQRAPQPTHAMYAAPAQANIPGTAAHLASASGAIAYETPQVPCAPAPQQPSALQMSLEQTPAAPSALHHSSAPMHEHRPTLIDIADAAAAAAAAESLRGAGAQAACANLNHRSAAGAVVSSAADQYTSNHDAASIGVAARMQSASALFSALQSEHGTQAAAAALDSAPGPALSPHTEEEGVRFSEVMRLGSAASIGAGVSKVGHKRLHSQRHSAASCTDDDSSDERSATIAIKDTGSDFHSVVPGVQPLVPA